MPQSLPDDEPNLLLGADTESIPEESSIVESRRRVAVVVASLGRAMLLESLVERLADQTLLPTQIVFSVIEPSDAPDLAALSARFPKLSVEWVIGPKGMTKQRNTGLERVIDTSDAVLFIDDDLVPSRYAIEGIVRAFEAFPEASGLTGDLLADGINSPGISLEEAQRIVTAHDAKGSPDTPLLLEELGGLYGCNMAYRTEAIRHIRFDERLPLYAWLEDIDFSAQVSGKLIRTDVLTGVHCGTKMGRERRGKLLGYSQIANPIYMARKGTMSPFLAARHCLRNFLANHLRAFRPEPWVDRRGRMLGNWLALVDIVRRKISPERILDF